MSTNNIALKGGNVLSVIALIVSATVSIISFFVLN